MVFGDKGGVHSVCAHKKVTDTHKRCLILTTSSTAHLAVRSASIWLSSHSGVQVPQVNNR